MRPPADPDLATRLFAGSPERLLALLRAAWPASVGPELARRTEVLAFDAGVLRIRVPDVTWRRGLLRMRADILARLREIAGSAAPRSLGFVEGAIAAPPSPVTPRSEPAAAAPGPELVEAAGAIPDAELRERFLASAAVYLARFRPRAAMPRPDGSAG
jgi:hypothetical protein